MKVKEESEKAGLKLNIQKTKIMASGPITSWQIQAPKSMYAGYKPTQSQYEQDLRDKQMITQAVMQDNVAYTGNNYTINVIVDDEVVKTETVKDRDFIMGGMSYTAGGN